MLTPKSALVGGIAGLATLAAGSASVQSAPLSYSQHISCAAIFYLFSEDVTDAEMVGNLEAVTFVMLERARALPQGRGLTQDQLTQAVVTEARLIRAAMPSESTVDQRTEVLISWGPGLGACLEAALADGSST